MNTMYKSFVLVFILFGVTSCTVKKIIFDPQPPRVKNVENRVDKDNNFIKANEWMVETFNNAQSVIQFTDKEGGIVKGKYVMREGYASNSIYVQSTPTFYAIITIRVKEGASRIEIDAPSGLYSMKQMGVEYGFTPEMFNASADRLIQSFDARMTSTDSNSDW